MGRNRPGGVSAGVVLAKPYKLQALGRAAQALAQAGARLDADRAGRALDRVLDAIGRTMDPDQVQALG